MGDRGGRIPSRGITAPALSRTGLKLILDRTASEEALKKIIQTNPSATQVILKGCVYASDSVIKEVVYTCRNLETLNIQFVSDRVTPAVAGILAQARNLQRVIISNLPDKSLEMALRTQFPISGMVSVMVV